MVGELGLRAYLAPSYQDVTFYYEETGALRYVWGNDLKMIADSGASISHCPFKYAKYGITLESFDRYVEGGVNVSLGTDSYPMDMVNEMRCGLQA
jgi:hypothetical protein